MIRTAAPAAVFSFLYSKATESSAFGRTGCKLMQFCNQKPHYCGLLIDSISFFMYNIIIGKMYLKI